MSSPEGMALLALAVIATVALFIFSSQDKPVDEVRYTEVSGQMRYSNEVSSATQTMSRVPSDVFAGIKKYVFFMGHGRSGHSIIGSLMDAHPHVVIAHQFHIFDNFDEFNKVPSQQWRDHFFELLYNDSVTDAASVLTDTGKGYSLEVEDSWQGKFDEYIEVIGDKSGASTTKHYIKHNEQFRKDYLKLKQELSIPMHIIYALRNPFDIISTKLNYALTNREEYRSKKLASTAVRKLKVADSRLTRETNFFFDRVRAAIESIDGLFGRENVLTVHNCDLVDDPRGIISRIFQFLEVDVSEHYLDLCAAKVFKSVSQSRDTIEWTPEAIQMVERRMKEYKMLGRYSFTSD